MTPLCSASERVCVCVCVFVLASEQEAPAQARSSIRKIKPLLRELMSIQLVERAKMSNQKQSQPRAWPRLGPKSSASMAKLSTFVLIMTNLLLSQTQASGIFEINLAALTDSYGRDLRLDCCAWQNVSQQASQQPNQQSMGFHHNHLHAQANSNSLQQQQQQQQTCDPTKCQLIIRICVKNYQTQIDPSQCTFGELSAQVMKPNEQIMMPHSSGLPQYNQVATHHYSSSSSSLARLQQQQQLAAFNKLRLQIGPNSQQQQVANIHQQRLLLQQLQMHSSPNSGQTNEQHSRLYHQTQSGPILSSGQARAMRQIAFDQPISFPFNFTWPVSGRIPFSVAREFNLLREEANLRGETRRLSLLTNHLIFPWPNHQTGRLLAHRGRLVRVAHRITASSSLLGSLANGCSTPSAAPARQRPHCGRHNIRPLQETIDHPALDARLAHGQE